MNPGNYCFMNAALQCLFATPGFVGAASKSPVHRHSDLLAALTRLAANVLSGRQTSAALEALRAQCEAVLPPDIEGGKFVVAGGDNPLPFWTRSMLGRQRQQDAHEFLVKLMDALDAVATPVSGQQHSPASAGKLSQSPIHHLFELRSVPLHFRLSHSFLHTNLKVLVEQETGARLLRRLWEGVEDELAPVSVRGFASVRGRYGGRAPSSRRWQWRQTRHQASP